MMARKLVFAIAALIAPTVAAAQGAREGWLVGASAEYLTQTFTSGLPSGAVRVTQLRPGRVGVDLGLNVRPGEQAQFQPDLGVSYALKNTGAVSVFFRTGATGFIYRDEGTTYGSVGPYVGAGLAVPIAGRFGLRFDVSPRLLISTSGGGVGGGVLLGAGLALLPSRK